MFGINLENKVGAIWTHSVKGNIWFVKKNNKKFKKQVSYLNNKNIYIKPNENLVQPYFGEHTKMYIFLSKKYKENWHFYITDSRKLNENL